MVPNTTPHQQFCIEMAEPHTNTIKALDHAGFFYSAWGPRAGTLVTRITKRFVCRRFPFLHTQTTVLKFINRWSFCARQTHFCVSFLCPHVVQIRHISVFSNCLKNNVFKTCCTKKEQSLQTKVAPEAPHNPKIRWANQVCSSNEQHHRCDKPNPSRDSLPSQSVLFLLTKKIQSTENVATVWWGRPLSRQNLDTKNDTQTKHQTKLHQTTKSLNKHISAVLSSMEAIVPDHGQLCLHLHSFLPHQPHPNKLFLCLTLLFAHLWCHCRSPTVSLCAVSCTNLN